MRADGVMVQQHLRHRFARVRFNVYRIANDRSGACRQRLHRYRSKIGDQSKSLFRSGCNFTGAIRDGVRGKILGSEYGRDADKQQNRCERQPFCSPRAMCPKIPERQYHLNAQRILKFVSSIFCSARYCPLLFAIARYCSLRSSICRRAAALRRRTYRLVSVFSNSPKARITLSRDSSEEAAFREPNGASTSGFSDSDSTELTRIFTASTRTPGFESCRKASNRTSRTSRSAEKPRS